MQSTLNPKQSDDPHDFVVVAPDAVRVAPADDELSSLLHDAARHLSDSQTRTATGFPAGLPIPPVDAPVPLVDTTFRPAAVDDVQGVQVSDHRRSMAKRALRAFAALLLAACIGGAAIAWRTHGDAAEKKIAKWATQLVLTVSLPPEKSGPAVQAVAAPAQPAPSAPSAVEAAAPSPDSAQLLQSMARDLASLGQEVEQLKASIEQIKASQQASRDAAKASEQNVRPRISAPPPRPAVARAHKPTPPLPPTQAAAPALPQAGAPYYASRQPEYVPRQIEPQPRGTIGPQADPELESVPRPPMPLR